MAGMTPDILPPRPDMGLMAILLYALLAFGIVLALTPWFVSFLHRNNIGKQLRVETLDGRDPTIFRTYHQKKFGTPTMGGVLMWGGIFFTVFLSRGLSLLGLVDHSLLQRGQVYLPLFVMITLGILGGLDDYINIMGTDEARAKRFAIKAKYGIVGLLGFSMVALAYVLTDASDITSLLPSMIVRFGTVGASAFIAAPVLILLLMLFGGTAIEAYLLRFLLSQGKRKGLGAVPKIVSLLLISIVGALWFYLRLDINSIDVPFYGAVTVGLWYIPLFVFVVVGTANAVNFTDGLDGLAGGLLVIAFGAFGVLAYLQGLTLLAAFCAVCVGAIAAFLWHNVPPALFFMGDTGSLALGGTLAVIAFMIDDVLILPFIGIVFVIEMLSVLIQLTSKRLRGGKKIFLAAPIHHHFEALGWGESKVTMRLWIVGSFFALLGIIIGLAG